MLRALVVGLFLISIPLLAEEKPKAVPKPKETAPRPPTNWPVPTPAVFPTFPGGGGGGSAPPPVIQPPPPQAQPRGGGGGNPPEKFFLAKRPKVEPDHPRPPLFITRGDRNNHTVPIPGISRMNEGLSAARKIYGEQLVTEEVIMLETFKRESENDLLIAQHDYANDQVLVDINRRLHAQVETLYRKQVIPRQTFEESRTKLVRIEAKSEESRARILEYQAEVDLSDLKVRGARGETILPLTHALAYAQLWEARLEKVKATAKATQAVYEFLALVHGMVKGLHQRGAESMDNLIKAERDVREAEVVMNLAQALVKKNEQNAAFAREEVKRAGEQQPSLTPNPGTSGG